MRELDEYLKIRKFIFDNFKFPEQDIVVRSIYTTIQDCRTCYWKRNENDIIVYSHCRKYVWTNESLSFKKISTNESISENVNGDFVSFLGIDEIQKDNVLTLYIFNKEKEVKKRNDNYKKFENRCKCEYCEEKFKQARILGYVD